MVGTILATMAPAGAARGTGGRAGGWLPGRTHRRRTRRWTGGWRRSAGTCHRQSGRLARWAASDARTGSRPHLGNRNDRLRGTAARLPGDQFDHLAVVLECDAVERIETALPEVVDVLVRLDAAEEQFDADGAGQVRAPVLLDEPPGQLLLPAARRPKRGRCLA